MKSIESSAFVEIIDWHKDHPIALFKEAADPTIESIQESWKLLSNLTEGKQFHMIADLSNASPPPAYIRSEVKRQYLKVKPNILSVQTFIGKNGLLEIALKFLAASMGLKNFEMTNSIESAIERIKNEH